MKKTLLSVAFLFATFVGANAQETISFESSEGYSLGDINTQNGWTVTTVGENVFSTAQLISDEYSSDGDYSFRIAKTPEAGGQANGPVVGGFYNFAPVSFSSISYDVYINDANDGTNGADYMIRTADINGAAQFTSLVYFSYSGEILVQGGSEVIELDITWSPNTWYGIRVEITDTNDIVYKINGTVVHQGAASATQLGVIDHVRFVHDNFSANGVAYLDNIKINVEENASVDNHLAPSFSIYPNPANDVINISYADAIENVTITDMNGRIVKQVVLGVNEGQINIADLSQGVYILNATSNGKSVTEKIVKR